MSGIKNDEKAHELAEGADYPGAKEAWIKITEDGAMMADFMEGDYTWRDIAWNIAMVSLAQDPPDTAGALRYLAWGEWDRAKTATQLDKDGQVFPDDVLNELFGEDKGA